GGQAELANAVRRVVAGVVKLPDAVLDQDPATLADVGVPLARSGGEDRRLLQRREARELEREAILPERGRGEKPDEDEEMAEIHDADYAGGNHDKARTTFSRRSLSGADWISRGGCIQFAAHGSRRSRSGG